MLALVVMAGLAWMNSRHKMQLMAGFAVAAAFMFAIGPGQMIERIQQIQIAGEAETGAEVSTRARVELAKAGLRMMEAHPLFGIGLDQFKSVEFHYNPVLTDLEPEPKSHTTRTYSWVRRGEYPRWRSIWRFWG